MGNKLITSVGNKFGFQPPNPPAYTLTHPSGLKSTKTLDGKDTIYFYYFPALKKDKDINKSNLFLIYSHGNGCDIGQLYDYMKVLREVLKISIVCYDYIGYGPNMHLQPSEENCYRSMDAVFNWVLNQKGVTEENIILYGTSLGSGVTCEFAVRKKKICGIILECPFTSACAIIRSMIPFAKLVTTKKLELSKIDKFVNIKKVPKFSAPTMIIHGMNDKLVPVSHGKSLWEKIPKNFRFRSVWVENAGHNNIASVLTWDVYLFHFILFVGNIRKKMYQKDGVKLSWKGEIEGSKNIEGPKKKKGPNNSIVEEEEKKLNYTDNELIKKEINEEDVSDECEDELLNVKSGENDKKVDLELNLKEDEEEEGESEDEGETGEEEGETESEEGEEEEGV